MKINDLIFSPIAGYSVARLTSRPVCDGSEVQTHSFSVLTPKGKTYLVDLYSLPDLPPHGWEATQPETTNKGGYYSTGGLSIVPTTGELEDYDGVFFLPRCVAVTLRALGFTVSDDCLADPIPVK